MMNIIKNMEMIKDNKGKYMMIVYSELKENNIFRLDNAFGIHKCNEFLRSLNLGNDIEFVTYEQYKTEIDNCFNLLMVKRVLDKNGIANKITPWEVWGLLLDHVSEKYHVNVVIEYKDKLEPYIIEALKIFEQIGYSNGKKNIH